MITVDTEWLSKLDPHALNSVHRNNERIVAGSEEVLVNPAYTKIPDSELQTDVERILDSVHLTSNLRKLEDANRSKFGPKSIAKPWVDREADLSNYFQHSDHDPGSMFTSRGRRLAVSYQTAGDHLMNSSSSGLPYMRRKGLVKEEAVQNAEELLGVYPCVLYTRTQEQGKTRNVWGFPIASTLYEQRIFQPWLSMEKSFPFRSALNGPDAVDAAITTLLASKSPDQVVVSVDFSAYDASIKPQHSYGAFDFIATFFQEDMHDLIYGIYRQFVTIPIYTPSGEWSGAHGVPSGSVFTNTVDSLVQYAVSGAQYRCQIQGDDGVYLVDKDSLSSFYERFKSEGLMLNEEKSDVFTDSEALYLQRYYHPDYKGDHGLGGVYPLMRAMNRIKYLERFTNFENVIEGRDFFALRTISILENCKHHPGFEKFVRLVHAQDKFQLTYSTSGLDAFSKMQESKVRAGVLNQYGEARGINSYQTVKLLRAL